MNASIPFRVEPGVAVSLIGVNGRRAAIGSVVSFITRPGKVLVKVKLETDWFDWCGLQPLCDHPKLRAGEYALIPEDRVRELVP